MHLPAQLGGQACALGLFHCMSSCGLGGILEGGMFSMLANVCTVLIDSGPPSFADGFNIWMLHQMPVASLAMFLFVQCNVGTKSHPENAS